MFPRYLRKAYVWHRQERHIMRALKFGKINHMIQNLIYGHWDAYCTKWLLWNLHSGQKTWKDCIKKLSEVFIQGFLRNFLKIWVPWSDACCRLTHKWGRLAVNFFIFRKDFENGFCYKKCSEQCPINRWKIIASKNN